MRNMRLQFIPASLLLLVLSCEKPVDEQPSAAQNVQVQSQPTTVPLSSSLTSRGAAITLEVEEHDFGTIWDFVPVARRYWKRGV